MALLFKAVEGRVPKLLPIKYARMSLSPFAFFRGAVAVMAADLASKPHTKLMVQLCGDAHLQNLGSYETPDGRVVFDFNDFDETIAGPWEWDVKRMAASIALAAPESGHSGASTEEAVYTFVRGYAATIEELAALPILVAARHQVHRLGKASAISAALQQAERARPIDLLKKYTAPGANAKPRFRSLEHVLWRIQGETRQQVLDCLPLYRSSLPPERVHLFDAFRPLDVAFKIVGTGSVGLRDYVVLMEGNGKRDPLFLQIKQEVESAYAPYLPGGHLKHQGTRVAEGQRRIQPVSDLLLGWTHIGGHDYLVRQLNDHKGSVDLAKLRGKGLNQLANVAGRLLARGHARSGDALAITGYIGKFDKVVETIVRFGRDYAALSEADFEKFKKSAKDKTAKSKTMSGVRKNDG